MSAVWFLHLLWTICFIGVKIGIGNVFWTDDRFKVGYPMHCQGRLISNKLFKAKRKKNLDKLENCPICKEAGTVWSSGQYISFMKIWSWKYFYNCFVLLESTDSRILSRVTYRPDMTLAVDNGRVALIKYLFACAIYRYYGEALKCCL